MDKKRLNVRYDLLVMLVLVLATSAVYLQVKDHDFVNYDDNEYITENRHVQGGLTSENVTWAFTTFYAGNWHPLTWISHMLDCQLFGMKPGFHHSVNFLFHIANAILLFLVFHRMTKGLWQSAFVAAVFAIHPLHVESVAWVTERKDVLSTFFWMLTMGAYAFYVERRELKTYLLALFFFTLGLMAKPMLVTLPFVLLLLDYWPLRRLTAGKSSINGRKQPERSLHTRSKKKERGRNTKKAAHINNTEKQTRQQPSMVQLVLEKTPFFVLSLASSIVTYMAQQKGGALRSLQSYSFSARVANALVSYCGYIGKMIWPENLAVLYPHPGILPIWQVIGSVLFLGMTTFLIIRSVKHLPYLTTGWLWYLGTLIPVIGLVQVGVQAMADRYTYIPIIGVLMMVAWGAPELLKKWRYRNAALAMVIIMIPSIFSYAAWKQVGYWQNNITLFKHTVEKTTNNPTMQNNLGNTLEDEGRLDEAIACYTEAVRIDPNLADSYNNMGLALTKQGRSDEAISNFLKAIRINPEGAAAHYNLGTLLVSQGKLDEAINHFRECVRIKPDHAKAYNNLGNALLYQGRLEEAIENYREAVRINPNYVMAHENLKNALAQQKKNQ